MPDASTGTDPPMRSSSSTLPGKSVPTKYGYMFLNELSVCIFPRCRPPSQPRIIWGLNGQISWKSVRKGVFSLGVVDSAQYARILHIERMMAQCIVVCWSLCTTFCRIRSARLQHPGEHSPLQWLCGVFLKKVLR